MSRRSVPRRARAGASPGWRTSSRIYWPGASAWWPGCGPCSRSCADQDGAAQALLDGGRAPVGLVGSGSMWRSLMVWSALMICALSCVRASKAHAQDYTASTGYPPPELEPRPKNGIAAIIVGSVLIGGAAEDILV